ncbi:HI0074 family nucleotidyltransferase substrate-binding subunit [Jeotgalibacillus sp. ET6]|uniref:HI0074 family nucleotidyltransferase substrate-binding subunit n=1 Tax=Jeotgalibacillus sp. ET6 TaxID=3037260 RepID=UPI0024184EBD|nr:HI0074 family nucleotidyltransferase substrate-binding subunit [Jeotgalibacillus sp. ET6]MDG5471335.1 HI0074 family nucleotidyltransferase substrate-binding subunit [Jeotgalibacillus sp. ET6]
MERLHHRLNSAKKALGSFQQLAMLDQMNEIERDAAIQRFKNSFEACWKAAKEFLYNVEGIDVGSPKGVIRSCREVNLLQEDETTLGLKMVNDRNLTVHTYNEEVAILIQSNLTTYYHLLEKWMEQIRARISEKHIE